MNRTVTVVATAAVIATLVAGALLWLSPREPQVPPPSAPVTSSAPAPAESVSQPATPAPPVQNPIDIATASVPLAASDIGPALTELFGRKAVLSFLQTDNFPQRFVATVDNLGRAQAPARMWPVNPTAGRFTTEPLDGESVIAADNALRYTPFVLLVETVDVKRAVDLYVRMYPLLQQAYEELGYPGRHFNDRVIEIIDHLLATPDAVYPTRLRLTDVKGPIPSERPWVRYEFADPALESLTAGQKILIRTGSVNERRLKNRLAEFRNELLKRAKPR